MKNMKKLSVICFLLILTVALAACNSMDFKLTADKTTATPGETVTFSSTLDDQPVNEATYSINEGAEYATITGNKLTVNSDAKAGARIQVVAKTANLTSNTVTVTVTVPVEGIEVSANGIANVMPGGSVILQKNVTPAGASDPIEWVIEEGTDIAAISGDVLVANANAPIGSLIKVYAKCGDIRSNSLTFTVGVPVTAVEISAIGSLEVVKGNTVTMTETVAPADASAAAVTYVIVEGTEYATITGKTLIVNSDAPTGATIKVKATVGTVESNVLTFTVLPTQSEINNTRYFMSFEQDNVTLDKNGAFTPTLALNVYNYNLESVSDLEIDYEVVSGDDVLAINPNGYTCAISALGHGTAIVQATIRGTDVSETVSVSVIVPPESISLPEVFRTRPGFSYNFSKLDPLNGNAPELLPFVATATGSNVCENLKYTFAHKSGATGDSVATYADGKITFHMTGEVTVTVSSASGSAVETTASYRFNINEGFNVSTFEELRVLADSLEYTGNLPINIVALDKLGEYGYSLVPAVALKPASEQTFAEVTSIVNRISFINKGAIINGNQHKIDASGVRVITSDEITENKALGNGWELHSSLLGIYPWSETETGVRTYSVSISDLEVVGNCPINLDLNTSSPTGVYKIGILIGDYHEDDELNANYYLNMQNVNATATNVGMRLLHIVDGKVKNAFVNNCYSNGIEVVGSIITLEDMVYGACGATGIEIVAQDCTKAGINRNQNQSVTYAGTITVQFYNNTETEYLANYEVVPGVGVPTILQASIGDLDETQMSHLLAVDENGNPMGYVFVTFMFHDIGATISPNTTEIIYPGFQSGGFINSKDLPKNGQAIDTTHEYIAVDIVYMGIPAGTAYFYNVNYAG